MKRIIQAIVLAATSIPPLGAQQAPTFSDAGVYVTAIDVVAEVRDRKTKRVPENLKPADFILLEDGVVQPIIGLEYLKPKPVATPASPAPTQARDTPAGAAPAMPAPVERDEWQIVVYFENQLSSAMSRKKVADAMAKRADELVRRGTVDVVFANPAPVALVRDSRDASAVRAALATVARAPGTNWLLTHRRQIYAIQQMGGLPVKNIVPYADEEVVVVSRFRSNITNWLSSYEKHSPRTLMVVSDGFDIDPADFYASMLNPNEQAEFHSYVSYARLNEATERFSRALAAGNWTTISIPGDLTTGGWVDDTSQSSVGRVHRFMGNSDPGKLKGPRSLVYKPIEPLQIVAERTGGSVVPNVSKIGEAIQSLDARIKVTYQVSRPPDGKVRAIELRPRDARLVVRAAQFASTGTPDEMAEARAVGLLRRKSGEGPLTVESTIAWDAPAAGKKRGTLFVTAPLEEVRKSLPQASPMTFRVTFAVEIPPGNTFVVSRMVNDHDQAAPSFRYRSPVDLPEKASQYVVTVEEMSTGAWGSRRVDMRQQ